MLSWFSDIRKEPWRLGKHGFAFLAMLMAWAFLWIVQWRVGTYVCGNDPMLYIRAARTLLRPDFYGAEAVRQALTFVAPGYPAFLAVAIKLFGPLSPYWINAVVLTAALPLMWFTFRRLMGSDRAAAFSLLAPLWIVFSGHPLHAPFLLYPFRETPRLFLVYLSYALLLAGRPSGRIRIFCLLASSLALLLACAIREPSALVLPGLLLGMVGLSSSWADRFKAWAWFLAPWLLAGIAAWVILSRFSVHDFSQFSVVRYLGNHQVAMERAGKMMAWFPERTGGWLGFFLIAIGVVRACWRNGLLLAWFLLPAYLFFAFCAYMQMHDRYFLTSMLFLAVFAGYGLEGLCVGVDRLFQSLAILEGWRRPASDVFAGCALLLLVVGLARTPGKLSVWGPAVRAAEVREWQALVAGLEPAADGRVRIATEQRTRYLEDMILSYTDAELLDPKRMDEWPPEVLPAYYFQPLNGKALWATPQWLMYLKVFAHRLIESRMDLVPINDAAASIRFIGAGQYAQYRVSAWRPGSHEQVLAVEPGNDQVLWLDFGAADPTMAKTIRVEDASTGEVWLERQAHGNGLLALALDGEAVMSSSARLRVSGVGPLPSQPFVAVASRGTAIRFDLGQDRRISANHWFPDRKADDDEIYCPAIESARALKLRFPNLVSDSSLEWKCILLGKWSQVASEWKLRISSDRHPERTYDYPDGSASIQLEGVPGELISLQWISGPSAGSVANAEVVAIEWRAMWPGAGERSAIEDVIK